LRERWKKVEGGGRGGGGVWGRWFMVWNILVCCIEHNCMTEDIL
jgi:hypothetical protein